MLGTGFLLQAATEFFTERDVVILATASRSVWTTLHSADRRWLLAHPVSLRSVARCHLPSIASIDATEMLFSSPASQVIQPRKRLRIKFDIELEYAMLQNSYACQSDFLLLGDKMALLIAQTLKGPNSLRRLTLGWPNIDYSEFLPNLPSQLECLTLHFLRQRDLGPLTDKLSSMARLTHLKLGFSEEPPDDTGYIQTDNDDARLARVVLALPASLRSLDLSSVFFAYPTGARTCKMLVERLPQLVMLSSLRLHFDEGVLPEKENLAKHWKKSDRNSPQVQNISALQGLRYHFDSKPYAC